MAFLTHHELASYLVAARWIRPAAVVAGDLELIDASERNSNFKVVRERGPSYLVKQGVDAERVATLAREAAFYRAFSTLPANQGMRRYTVRCHGYDAVEHVLVLELMRDALDFREAIAAGGALSLHLARELGQALATLHREGVGSRVPEGLSTNSVSSWALSLHRPALAELGRISAANLRVLGILQRAPDIGERLDRLQSEWRATAWIHGDVRWANCLSVTRLRAAPALKLVDWELAGRGYSAWDAGAVFAEHLSGWLTSLPILDERSLSALPAGARRSLSRVRRSLGTFWSSYARHAGLSTTERAESLLRAMRYAGARLLQGAYEHMQSALELTTSAVTLLQLGTNVLREPEAALVELCGFARAR